MITTARTRSGFTLVEILLVVAIIGILASIVLISLGPVQRQGRDARRLADLRSAQTALELYYNKCGYYPGPASCGSGWGASAADWPSMSTVLTGSGLGINQVPNDPSTGRNYEYNSFNNGSSYVIDATLEDANNPALRQSASGTIGSITGCGVAGKYCIQF